MRPYIAEGSGNDAMIVLAGADLDRAAQAAAVGGFANAGQLCMAAKRIIVERAVWEAFRPGWPPPWPPCGWATLRRGHRRRPAGRGRARASAREALAEALDRGGRVLVGEGERGPFFTPTVVELPRAALDVALWRCESFALRGGSSPRTTPTPWR